VLSCCVSVFWRSGRATDANVTPSLIPYRDRDLVRRVLDVLVPADEQPSATEAGALAWLDARAATDHAELWRDVLKPGFDALRSEADLVDEQLLRQLEKVELRHGWDVSPQLFVATMTTLAAHAWYGRRDSPAWGAMGFDPSPKRSPGAPVRHAIVKASPFGETRDRYDAVIVGAGAGGGVAAQVLTAAGARILIIERGRFLPFAQVGRDHLAHHRLAIYGHNTGPEDTAEPRVYAPTGEPERVVRLAHAPEWHNNAMTVGGGTRVYQGMAWRFQPDDFRMASCYGVPDKSSLADWPLSYDELEPYYTRAEWELGVCGDAHAHRTQGRRSADYPMPPLPDNLEASVLRAGARKLGLATGPVPLLLNSEPRSGRAACVRCGECVGFACPTDAKNGTHNTTIPQAMATGLATLMTGARAERVLIDGASKATGVAVVDLATGARREILAGAVVLCAGAIETARLLLASATDTHPAGLGNRSGHVGRHLQGHLYVGAFGLFDDAVQDGYGPGVSIATADFTHDLGGEAIGGGVLANECVKVPAVFWHWALAPGTPRWGRSGKRAVREAYRRTSHIFGPIHEIPSPECRVTLAAGVRDAQGNAVARLAGRLHPDSVKSARALQERARRWMHASGATRVWSDPDPVPDRLTGGQHQAGTARMGDDPATSVTDPYGRVHGHPRLWVMDASLHVTNGGVNPVLTIYALAYRCAEELARGGSG
jgi:choline dehydrogenase-like flavoprotein